MQRSNTYRPFHKRPSQRSFQPRSYYPQRTQIVPYKRNHEIKSQEVRLIDSDGTNLGVVDVRVAMNTANERGMDLVEVAPQADPPVCRVILWSKFMYELKKKEKESRKNKQKEMKEFRFGTFIAEGDKQRQINRAREFLEKGHNVRLTVTRRGRTPIGQSKELLKDLLTRLSEYSTIDANPTVEGRFVFIILKGAPESHSQKDLKPDGKAKNKKNSIKKVSENQAAGGEG